MKYALDPDLVTFNIIKLKGYLRKKIISSGNVVFDSQFENFLFLGKVMLCSKPAVRRSSPKWMLLKIS